MVRSLPDGEHSTTAIDNDLSEHFIALVPVDALVALVGVVGAVALTIKLGLVKKIMYLSRFNIL